MKRIITGLLFILSTILIQANEYTLVWNDEFDDDSLSVSKWNIQFGGGGWGNNEFQFYTARSKNVRVENGFLILEALKERYINSDYTSARINTKGKGFVKYGKIEARISLPTGAGTWPAFWMMPENNLYYGGWPASGEIDIMEHKGSEPSMISNAVHTYNKSADNCWNYQFNFQNIENNFHIYGIEWEEKPDGVHDCIRFYIDDTNTTTIWEESKDYKMWPFNHEFYILLNIAVGGGFGGPVDNTIFNSPVQMKVDYVHMFKKTKTADNQNIKSSNIKIYPTRITDKLYIESDIPTNLEIYNSYGCLFKQFNLTDNSILDTDTWLKGLYILRTNDSTLKIIK